MTTEITTWAELAGISGDTAGDYILMNDLGSGDTGYDTYASSSANGGAGWDPIGGSSSPWFTGTFNGGGHVVSDVYINRSQTPGGFFTVVAGTVYNLGLADVDITFTGTTYYHGAFCGQSYSADIDNCYVTGTLSGRDTVGGFTAYHRNGTIDNCYAFVNVTGTASYKGGFQGYCHGDSYTTNCYCVGTVTGGNAKGFSGGNRGTAAGNFYDSTVSGLSDTYESTPKTTTEMKTLSTFTGASWDIVAIGDYVDETWFIDAGNDYPRLGWEYAAPPPPEGAATQLMISGDGINLFICEQ